MTTKWSVRILLALLCVTVLCSTPAYATENRASEQINSTSITLTKKNSGDLSIFFSVQGTAIMDVIGADKVEIQRNTITGWITEFTFTPDNTPEIQTESSGHHNTMLTYSPLFSRAQYRAVVTIYVEDASGSSTQKLTSRTV